MGTDINNLQYVAGLIDGGVEITVRIRENEYVPTGYEFIPGLRYETTRDPALVATLDEFAEQIGIFCEASSTSEGYVWLVTGTHRIKKVLEAVEGEIWLKEDDVKLMLNEIIPLLETEAHHDEEQILELMEHVEQLDWRQRFNQYNRYTLETFQEEFPK